MIEIQCAFVEGRARWTFGGEAPGGVKCYGGESDSASGKGRLGAARVGGRGTSNEVCSGRWGRRFVGCGE